MPESKKRPTAHKVPRTVAKPPSTNPRWLVPTAVSLLILGPLWIVIHYVSRGDFPLPLGPWNLGVGFVFLAAGMVLLTRWK